MAFTELVFFSWKEPFRDPSRLLDCGNNKRGPSFPHFAHTQRRAPLWLDNRQNPHWVMENLNTEMRAPLWLDNRHNPHWVMENLNTERVQDEELCVLKVMDMEEVHIHEHKDRPALFHSIKSFTEQKDLVKGCRLHAHILKRGLLKNDITLGNALLSMYVKCSALAKVQEVFNQLSARNVITWNAIISGYAQHGLGHEALHCFQQMQEEGLSPNAVTFISGLKACGSLEALEKGEDMHVEISRRRLLENEIVLGTALVDMYATCGALAKAQGVFNTLPVRNVITWNVLLAGYAQHTYGDEALSYFEQMQEEGFSPDAATFLCILKACGSIGAAEKGEEIHEDINKQGLLEKNDALGNALVDMYMKCGKLAKAKAVFDKLPTRSVVSWNSLLDGYIHDGQCDEALSCFERMQDEGLSPDVVTFLCILKACGSIGAVKKGEQIHKEVDRQGLLGKNNVLGNALVDMYAKCGMLAKAQAVFDKLPTWDVVSWNALIDGYAQHGLSSEVLSCFVQMQDEGLSPDAVTFVSILKCCGSIRAIEKGEEIHAKIRRHGLVEKDIVLGNALVDMYAKCGVLDKAQNTFDKLPAWNIVSWNVLITGYAQHALNEKALSCFERMRDEGFSPNIVTYLCILKACGSLGIPNKGEEIHVEVDRQGLLEKSVVLGNALVDMYAKCGALVKAQGVFDKLPARNVVTWNTMIAGYTQHGHADEAVVCFRRMQGEGLFPDSVTFICLLKACSSLGAAEKGAEIHAMVNQQSSLGEDSVLATALVDMYAKCGILAKAQGVFDTFHAHNVVMWNALLSGYAQVCNLNMFFITFTKMIEEGIEPDDITFIVLLTACSHAGLVEEGQMYFHTMSIVHGIAPTLEHCTCMVDMFSRAGHFDKAISMIKSVPPSDCLVLWSALMGACQNWVIVEVGRWAFEHVVQLDDSSAAAYVCMRNIYVASGMPNEVTKVEETSMSTTYGR